MSCGNDGEGKERLGGGGGVGRRRGETEGEKRRTEGERLMEGERRWEERGQREKGNKNLLISNTFISVHLLPARDWYQHCSV